MLKHSPSREVDIIRYVDETLLGPVSPGLLPLFPRETKLKSLLYRDGVVYADFSDNAALPPIEGGKTLDNFRTLYSSILRNFPYIKDVRFFIDGNAIFVYEFYQEGADNQGFFAGV
ncbi:MAG: GerMN domain-containing protein [Treponema sp.]|nr:GerMN domain-containing protein [Treponema sp.]